MIQQEYKNVNLHGLTLVVVVGAWLVGILIDSSISVPSFALITAMGVLLLSLILFWYERRCRLVACMLLFMLLGAWRYSNVSLVDDPQAIFRAIGLNVVVRGIVSDEPRLQGSSRLLSITTSSLSWDKGTTWQDAHGQMTIQTRGMEIEDIYGANYGSNVEVSGKLIQPLPHSTVAIKASMIFPRVSVQGMGGNPIIAVLFHWRIQLSHTIEQALPEPLAALLVAIVLSARTPAIKALSSAFSETGTAHLITPSGFKVTILSGIVASNLAMLDRKKKAQGAATRKRGGWGRWVATCLIIVSIVGYTLLSGAGPAAIRAGIMGILLVVAPRIGRTYNIYTALAATALLMSTIDPFVLWDVGFQLSFLGTLGIVVLTPLLQRLWHPLERIPFSHFLLEPFAVTVAAQIATLPIVALNFQVISYVAPLSNMLTVPLLGIMVSLGMLISVGGIMFMPLATLFGSIAYPLLWYLNYIIKWSADLAGAYTNVGTFDSSVAWGYYIFLVPVVSLVLQRWPQVTTHNRLQTQHNRQAEISQRTWKSVLVCLALIILGTTEVIKQNSPSQAQVTITFLQVGPVGEPVQGEAILIRTPDNKTILIDGGLNIASLAQELDNRLPSWQHSLDAVLLTAPIQDHLNGLLDIVQRYTVEEKVIDGGMLHPSATYALWRRTISERNLPYFVGTQGKIFNIGSFVSLQILWPSRPLHKGSGEIRDNGVIVRIKTPGLNLLLLGASAQSRYALTGLLNDTKAADLQAGVVQMVEETNTPFLRR